MAYATLGIDIDTLRQEQEIEERGSGRFATLLGYPAFTQVGLDPAQPTETVWAVLVNRFTGEELTVTILANTAMTFTQLIQTLRREFDTEWGLFETWSSSDPF